MKLQGDVDLGDTDREVRHRQDITLGRYPKLRPEVRRANGM